MKKKRNYKTKRTIIIASIFTILLAATSTGVYIFLKGNTETVAVDAGRNLVETNSVSNENVIIQEEVIDTSEVIEEIPEENTIEEENEPVIEAPANEVRQNTTRQTQIPIQTPVRTPTRIPVQTPIQPTEYIVQRREEREIITKSDMVGWKPMELGTISTDVNVIIPSITYRKEAIIENSEVSKGEKIVYKIYVENTSGRNLNNINVSDIIPEGTELVENSISDNGKLTNNKISWEINIPDGEVKEVSFEVTVTAESGTIRNTAVVEDHKTNETENTIKRILEGLVKITNTDNSHTQNTIPVDVVLVLDISNSMTSNNRVSNMVTAVNNVMTTIMSKNIDNRIAIVAYNSTSSILVPLGSYTPKVAGAYLNYTKNNSIHTITTNINDITNKSVNLAQGTYTQSGIATGVGVLENADIICTVEGKEAKRIPVFILLSDGEPSLYTTSYDNVGATSDVINTTANDAYYTIKTAIAYKPRITSHYGKVNFYTIGFNTSGTLMNTVLNPNKTNIDACANSESGTARVLYDLFTTNGDDPYGFNYADGSYSGSMDATTLTNILTNVINTSTSSTETRPITTNEFDNQKVKLTNIDTEKAFSIICGTTNYNTLADAINAGVVSKDTNNTYYVDLSKITIDEQLIITYHTTTNN